MSCCPFSHLPKDMLIPIKATEPDGTVHYSYMKQSVIDRLIKASKEVPDVPKRKRSTGRSTKRPY